MVALVDSSKTQLVEYTYDAWGKILTKIGTLAATLGTLNPFRWRGYVYDVETNLYYLRSRYYSPPWHRFINTDALFGNISGLLNHNLFSYCGNNPICGLDSNGYHYATIGSGKSLLNLINNQTTIYAYIDQLLAEQQRIIDKKIPYKWGGQSDKEGYDCITFISHSLQVISTVGNRYYIKSETGVMSMLRNNRDCFLLIANLSDYDLNDIPIGMTFLREKNYYEDYPIGHAATYVGWASDGMMMFNEAIGVKVE